MDVLQVLSLLSQAGAALSLVVILGLALRQRGRRPLPKGHAEEGQGVEFTEDAEQRLTARPQVLHREGGVQEVWPEYWGITLAQVRDFLAECRKDPAWDHSQDMYTVVEKYVKPLTAGTGLGLGLLRNQDNPLEVGVMVSHAWSENVEEFVKSLELSVSDRDVLFICAFSIYQNEDEHGPTIKEQLGSRASESPFRRTLEHIRDCGSKYGTLWRFHSYWRRIPGVMALMAITWLYLPLVSAGCFPTATLKDGLVCYRSADMENTDEVLKLGALKGKWDPLAPDDAVSLWVDVDLDLCCALVCAGTAMVVAFVLHLSTPYRGKMLVVPNRQCDLYTRLWCVYEIYTASVLQVPIKLARSLARAGGCSSREASCGSLEDTMRIRHEIEEFGSCSSVDGYAAVDRTISRTKRQARNKVLIHMCSQAWPMMLNVVAIARILVKVSDSHRCFWLLQVIVAFCFGIILANAVLFALAKRRQGRPSERDLLCMDLLFLLFAGFWAGLALIISDVKADSSGDSRADIVTRNFMWMAFLAGFYFIFSVSLFLVLIIKRLLDCFPCRLDLLSVMVKGEPLIQFVIAPLCVFGVCGLHGAITTAFYTVVLTAVLVSLPTSMIRSALAWDVRIRAEPAA